MLDALQSVESSALKSTWPMLEVRRFLYSVYLGGPQSLKERVLEKIL
jgi:hypothetical protein